MSIHNDDEVLWTTWTILREKPLVVIVYDSYIQFNRGTGITAAQRRKESQAAMAILGADVEFMGVSDADGGSTPLDPLFRRYEPEHVYAPAIEVNGNFQHNLVGQSADRVFGARVTHYMTYTTAGKSLGVEVPYERSWPMLKLRALACYESQIAEPSTAPHFLRSQLEYREP